jgi:hypothetical protein
MSFSTGIHAAAEEYSTKSLRPGVFTRSARVMLCSLLPMEVSGCQRYRRAGRSRRCGRCARLRRQRRWRDDLLFAKHFLVSAGTLGVWYFACRIDRFCDRSDSVRSKRLTSGATDGLTVPGRPQARRLRRPASRLRGLTSASHRQMGTGAVVAKSGPFPPQINRVTRGVVAWRLGSPLGCRIARQRWTGLQRP